MGEYIGNTKIGTCEDLYYARVTDLQKMQGTSEYLDPTNGFRYRFPFPDEDDVKVGNYDPYNKGHLVTLSAKESPKLYALMTSADYEHQTICHSASYNNHAVGVNMIMPCPLSVQFKETKGIRLSQGGATVAIVIQQLKQVDGEMWTVIACPYCSAKIRLDKEHAEDLSKTLTIVENRYNHHAGKITEYRNEYNVEIAQRMMAGYK